MNHSSKLAGAALALGAGLLPAWAGAAASTPTKNPTPIPARAAKPTPPKAAPVAAPVATPVAAPAPRPAALSPFTIEGAIGRGNIDVTCSGAPSCDRSSTGFKLAGGWQLTPAVAAELGYFDFGRTRLGFGPALGSVDVKATALGMGIAGRLNLAAPWSLVGRVGLARVHGRVSGAGSSTTDNALNPYFGVGVGYQIDRQISVGLNYDRSRVEINSDHGSVSLLSLGAQYRF